MLKLATILEIHLKVLILRGTFPVIFPVNSIASKITVVASLSWTFLCIRFKPGSLNSHKLTSQATAECSSVDKTL